MRHSGRARPRCKEVEMDTITKLTATYIIDLAKGERRVSELMHDRDVASIMWESSREALNVCKLQVRVLEAQAEREWSNAHRL